MLTGTLLQKSNVLMIFWLLLQPQPQQRKLTNSLWVLFCRVYISLPKSSEGCKLFYLLRSSIYTIYKGLISMYWFYLYLPSTRASQYFDFAMWCLNLSNSVHMLVFTTLLLLLVFTTLLQTLYCSRWFWRPWVYNFKSTYRLTEYRLDLLEF